MSPPPIPPESPSPEPPEVDGFAQLRDKLHALAMDSGDWAGIPMPLHDLQLVVEPTYRYAQKLTLLQDLDRVHREPEEKAHLRNRFWSWRFRSMVSIWQYEDGQISWNVSESNQLSIILGTLMASDVWGIEQENTAIATLTKLVPARSLKQYLLTGMFLETSRRSGVMYLFRRLRPTIALRAQRILCALCMHPIGYYADTWSGAMTPTDDVIAHLMLMRGDEHMFWRRSNQHPPWVHQAGI